MPRKIFVFFSVLTAFFLIVIATQLTLPIIKIGEVECRIDEQACPPELAQKLESIKGKSFFFSSLEAQVLNLGLNLYQLNSISKSWPTTVALKFSHKPNSYIIRTSREDQLLLIAENGLAQPISIEQNLPLIEVYNWDDAIQENHVSTDLHQLNLNLIQLLASQNIPYKNIKIYNFQQIEILLQEELIAIAQVDELEKQIVKLSIVLDELDLKAIDLQINQIDLRFKFPVLKTSH
jgi:hypothetical protein